MTAGPRVVTVHTRPPDPPQARPVTMWRRSAGPGGTATDLPITALTLVVEFSGGRLETDVPIAAQPSTFGVRS